VLLVLPYNLFTLSGIWGPHSGEDDRVGLLACNTMETWPTFQRNTLPSSSLLKPTYNSTWYYNPQDARRTYSLFDPALFLLSDVFCTCIRQDSKLLTLAESKDRILWYRPWAGKLVTGLSVAIRFSSRFLLVASLKTSSHTHTHTHTHTHNV
jgi:hypothetical protein